jgi:hypothetical protein
MNLGWTAVFFVKLCNFFHAWVLKTYRDCALGKPDVGGVAPVAAGDFISCPENIEWV